MKLEYVDDETVKSILGYRFVLSNGTFDYSIPKNKCFCSSAKKAFKNDTCLKNGIMDLAPCTGKHIFILLIILF